MDLTIVAVYTICDDLLIALGHQDDPRGSSLRDTSQGISKPLALP